MGEQGLKGIVAELSKTMQCNCDLDKWEPERSTGHSWVCRIHKRAWDLMEERRRAAPTRPEE